MNKNYLYSVKCFSLTSLKNIQHFIEIKNKEESVRLFLSISTFKTKKQTGECKLEKL